MKTRHMPYSFQDLKEFLGYIQCIYFCTILEPLITINDGHQHRSFHPVKAKKIDGLIAEYCCTISCYCSAQYCLLLKIGPPLGAILSIIRASRISLDNLLLLGGLYRQGAALTASIALVNKGGFALFGAMLKPKKVFRRVPGRRQY